jgi:predicted O-linked N-acetylglucosamine transferase (SPINDLY family)
MDPKEENAKIGDIVKVHFLCKLEDGMLVESSFENEPLEFRIGEYQYNLSLELSVVGMLPNESKSFKIPSDKAFGPYIKELIQTIKREQLPQQFDLQIGTQLQVPRDDGQAVAGIVTSISNESVTIDTNHPLAGKDLSFVVKLLEITRPCPPDAEEYNALGINLQKKGNLDKAIICYQKAIKLNPELAAAFNNLGHIFHIKGQYEEAIKHFQKVIQLNPTSAEAYFNLAQALYDQGKHKESITTYDMAISKNPKSVKSLWAKCISQIPIFYENEVSVKISRKHYHEELKKLRHVISLKAQRDIDAAAEAIGSQRPFYLAYQTLNDRSLQKLYGELICRIMSFKYPQWSVPLKIPCPLEGEPVRVGIVSGFFSMHSNWKIPIKGWVENIEKKRFMLHGYYTAGRKDQGTVVASRLFSSFIQNVDSFEKLCHIIRGDNLHMLIYPEIGMDSITMKLASLRLAPVQCTSWGHPDTSGLPTIDYFLSSDLMEPPDADAHYTEKLVRLPNLSIHYSPADVLSMNIDRKAFGLHEDAILYLCCQSLFKYLPQYDKIYPLIARDVGNCQFIFIAHKSSYITEQLQSRLRQSFHELGMEFDKHIVFLPQLDKENYNAINSLSDIYLDSIGWSGCNSTFEAIACDLPIVTLPGKLMRGRHSSAILNMMGVTETIASDLDEYVKLAVRLGMDTEWRRRISAKVAAKKHLVYRDHTCVTALEDFIVRAVKGKSA